MSCDAASRLLAHCQQELKALSEFFGVPPPKLIFRYTGSVFDSDRVTAVYVAYGKKIVFGVNDFIAFLVDAPLRWERFGRKIVSLIISHEFHHHLQRLKHGFKIFDHESGFGMYPQLEIEDAASKFSILWTDSNACVMEGLLVTPELIDAMSLFANDSFNWKKEAALLFRSLKHVQLSSFG
ncbi:MAG: hypothetical protein NWF09_07495 [Candidatus Bathyarchaeota archaeon]|nr:hypothetical protein [Candidatus Bathyarchaeota archaeon]